VSLARAAGADGVCAGSIVIPVSELLTVPIMNLGREASLTAIVRVKVAEKIVQADDRLPTRRSDVSADRSGCRS